MQISKYLFFLFLFNLLNLNAEQFNQAKIAYIATNMSIPFWEIMSNGAINSAKRLGYNIEIFDSENDNKKELENTIKAINEKVSGIIISPNNSSSCATILKLAKKANIPVIISDIGSESDNYISYISSDNEEAAYEIGKVLGQQLNQLNIENPKVAIIAISQKRINAQQRTSGFVKAMTDFSIKTIDIKQQINFSKKETYNFTKEIIEKTPDLNAIWLQTSNEYQAALDAINDSGKKDKILLLTFDAEPEFLDLILNKTILASAMQQPFLMGEQAVITLDKYLHKKEIKKNYKLSVLTISKENIKDNLPIIKRNVFGIVEKNNSSIQVNDK
jgi:ribose transport system substrate-binding protein